MSAVDTSQLPVFVIASVIFVITPGVDVFLLLRTSVRTGTRAGLLTLAGIHSASLVHVALVVSGLGVVLASNPGVLTALRWLGAAYLTYLALGIARDVWRSRGGRETGDEAKRCNDNPFRRGFVCNITNPKMLLFCLAFLPQFMGAASSPVLQLGLLGVVFLALAAAWETGIVLTAARVSGRLQRPAVLTTLDVVSATAFLTMSVGLVV
ncbi:LysE family translocator [Allokutzneria albata]|uniref:Threonine/homoserine/homoserine lactone efflux protein n=1 Tax=Allokutzneria albata TaxID=211114 RepID=A0A1G9XAA4_ALLAB|nr:LysE family translocator [Allokutzneria albata]SDM93471.1 Threonine/homoserine/homoserine lactone efflux protein [Allokutzneria albata]